MPRKRAMAQDPHGRTEENPTGRDRFNAWLDHQREEYGRRTGKRVTQKDLAKRLGLSNATEISHWKTGARTPSPDAVARMARLFAQDATEARHLALQIQVALGLMAPDLFDLPPLPVPRNPHQERLNIIERQLQKTDLSKGVIKHLLRSADSYYRQQAGG